MSTRHFRRTEHRRTARVTFAVPLTVHLQNHADEKLCVRTYSQSINGHGGLIVLEETVGVGQTLHLENRMNGQSAECRVVSVRRSRDAKTYVGVEFLSPDTNFWHMAFPIPGARPLRRPFPSKIYASI